VGLKEGPGLMISVPGNVNSVLVRMRDRLDFLGQFLVERIVGDF